MPVSVQITVIISIVVLSVVAFLCSVVKNQQRIEEMEAIEKNNKTIFAVMEFLKENPEFQKFFTIKEKEEE